jgi:RNA polymerase sigma-70 factor (ECF subfamily)
MDVPQVERDGERELISRAKAGDRAAFAALVREHGNEVYTLARRLVGDPHVAADWLHRITVNTAWTHKKKARRHRGYSLDEVADVAAPMTADHPEIAGEILELRGRLRQALDALPEAQRHVVVMKDVYQWTHAEIAEAMGISVSAAKVRLHRARARMARHLEASA